MAAKQAEPIVFEIRGPIDRRDLPGLTDRVCRLLGDRGGRPVVCDVARIEPDAVIVDALARLQLAARRHGCRIELRHTSAALRELVGLMGLSDVLADA